MTDANATDLQKLRDEVLCRDASAALPCNLSLEWLHVIGADIDRAFAEETSPDLSARYLAAPLALVAHLLCGQSNATLATIDLESLMRYCGIYRTEVAVECVRRCTAFQAQPATLENIFTDRQIGFRVRS